MSREKNPYVVAGDNDVAEELRREGWWKEEEGP